MALRNHLIHVDDLIALQQSRLRGLDEEFKLDTAIIKEEFDREKADIERTHEMETQELKLMIETIHEVENAKITEMMNDHSSKREETKNKNVEELEIMKHDLIKKIEELDKEFEVHFNKYEADTDTKAKEYKNLLGESQKLSGEISGLTKNIENLKE
jgi:DNA anti-recombination protein RmuC